jgi:hypothetical protein
MVAVVISIGPASELHNLMPSTIRATAKAVLAHSIAGTILLVVKSRARRSRAANV